MSGIRTIKQKTTIAYQVIWGKASKNETAFFSQKIFGTKGALIAAINFKKILDSIHAPEKNKLIKPYKNNTSGVNGIRLQWDEMRSGNIYAYIVTNYVDANGRNRGAAYSVNKHGLEGALQLAINKRIEHGNVTPSLKECLTIFLPQLK